MTGDSTAYYVGVEEKPLFVPPAPKIYHIVHVDRLPSIVADGYLACDSVMSGRTGTGTAIGLDQIKRRRRSNELRSHPGLHVGECVPFYFCPRSVMLYVIDRANYPELTYRGGQGPIVHLEADLRRTVAWADAEGRRWAFTTSNAGSTYFEDYADLGRLDKINWDAVQATYWQEVKEDKQAEFLVELSFPWHLVDRVGIGVRSPSVYGKVLDAMRRAKHRPDVEIKPGWYY